MRYETEIDLSTNIYVSTEGNIPPIIWKHQHPEFSSISLLEAHISFFFLRKIINFVRVTQFPPVYSWGPIFIFSLLPHCVLQKEIRIKGGHGWFFHPAIRKAVILINVYFYLAKGEADTIRARLYPKVCWCFFCFVARSIKACVEVWAPI